MSKGRVAGYEDFIPGRGNARGRPVMPTPPIGYPAASALASAWRS